METRLLFVQGKKSAWSESAAQELAEKIGAIVKFKRVALKAAAAEREDSDQKREAEGRNILKNLSSNETVILFDEGGKVFKDSREFSSAFVKVLSGQKPVTFVIGGPFGFSEEVRKRANFKWSLSPLTMNHHVAQVAALEQIFRALTIWKNLPYHN